jgi:large subunit ribosomal protein L1
MKRSKKYRAAAEKIKIDNLYGPGEAMKLVKETSTVKYDATVDVALFLRCRS